MYDFKFYVDDSSLEGVFFEAILDDDFNITEVSVEEEAQAYFSQLNEEYWLKVAKEIAQDDVDYLLTREDIIDVLTNKDEKGRLEI